MKWAVELSEYDIHYVPQVSVKGQVATDFITELTLTQLEESVDPGRWTLHTNGSTNDQSCGVGILLTNPEGSRHEYALRFKFPTSNNEVEYEVLLAGLRLAQSMGARHLSVISNSQLIINQINQEYEAKDHRMALYLKKVRALLNTFKTNTVE